MILNGLGDPHHFGEWLFSPQGYRFPQPLTHKWG